MICLDTSAIIDLLRNKPGVIEKIKGISQNTLATTRINIFEILFGIFIKNEEEKQKFSQNIQLLIDNINILEFNELACIQSAKIKSDLISQGKEIESTDCLIAGTMLANNCNTIVTKNKKHFDRIKGINVKGY